MRKEKVLQLWKQDRDFIDRTIELIRVIPKDIPIVLLVDVFIRNKDLQTLTLNYNPNQFKKRSSYGLGRFVTIKSVCIVKDFLKVSLKVDLITAELSRYPFTKNSRYINVKCRDIVGWEVFNKRDLPLMINHQIKTRSYEELLKEGCDVTTKGM